MADIIGRVEIGVDAELLATLDHATTRMEMLEARVLELEAALRALESTVTMLRRRFGAAR
jgi:hypothetical protein